MQVMQEKSCLRQQVTMKCSKSVPAASALAQTQRKFSLPEASGETRVDKQTRGQGKLEWGNFILYHCHIPTRWTQVSTSRTASSAYFPWFVLLCFPHRLLAPCFSLMSLFTQLQKASSSNANNHPSSLQMSLFCYSENVPPKTAFLCCLMIGHQVMGGSLV